MGSRAKAQSFLFNNQWTKKFKSKTNQTTEAVVVGQGYYGLFDQVFDSIKDYKVIQNKNQKLYLQNFKNLLWKHSGTNADVWTTSKAHHGIEGSELEKRAM